MLAGNRSGPAGVAPAVEPRVAARSFRSRPDLHPATVAVSSSAGAAAGYLFLGPGAIHGAGSGPLIVDRAGEPIWFRPLPSPRWVTNFSVEHYGGQPALIWWEGEVLLPVGYGQGEGVILDSSYREIGRVRAAGGRQVDMHELRLTPDGTALFTCFPQVAQADLSALGGPRDGRVLESTIQEVDIRTGRMLMEWRSLDHIPVAESYRSLTDPYDYLHINSIDLLPDGHLLISGRATWALYKLDRRTGQVIWRLGGKESDFALPSGARFSWQHDARQIGARTITLFDDGSDGPIRTEAHSRAIVLDVDDRSRTVHLRDAYQDPRGLSSSAMGSVQTLPDGHVFVGWGTQPYASEFAPDGTLVAEAAMAAGEQSYRAFRLPWTGTPRDLPALAAARDRRSGDATLYVSWNGSTEVTHWQVRTGSNPTRLQPYTVAPRTGFETAIRPGVKRGYCAVAALDRSGRVLAASVPIEL